MQVERPASRARELRAAGRPGPVHHVDDLGPDHRQEHQPRRRGEQDFTRAEAQRERRRDGLYPYLDGVGVYAGNCAANDPSLYKTNYFNPSRHARLDRAQPGRRPARRQRRDADAARDRHPAGRRLPHADRPSWLATQVMRHPARHRLHGDRHPSAGRHTGVGRTRRAVRHRRAVRPLHALRRTRVAHRAPPARRPPPPRITADRRPDRTPVPGTPNRATTLTTGTTTSPARRPAGDVLLMKERLRQLRSDQSGFTLPELITAMAHRHDRAAGRVHAARPRGLGLDQAGRPPGGRPARAARDGADHAPAALAGLPRPGASRSSPATTTR